MWSILNIPLLITTSNESSWIGPSQWNLTPILGNAIPVLGVKLKGGCDVFSSFFCIDVCSGIPMESFRRDLLNDMAEHRPILKNNQNTYYPRFSFTPKNRELPETGASFLRCHLEKKSWFTFIQKKSWEYLKPNLFLQSSSHLSVLKTRVLVNTPYIRFISML